MTDLPVQEAQNSAPTVRTGQARAGEPGLTDEPGLTGEPSLAGGLRPRDDARVTLAVVLPLALLVALGESGGSQAAPAAIRLGVDLPRLLLGLATILFVPGYWIVAGLFPAEEDLDGMERVGLSLGLSVAWVSVLALILDRLPWGLRLWPVMVGEAASILAFMGMALWRRARLPAGQAYAPPGWRPWPWWRQLPREDRAIYRLCIAALLIAGLAAAWIFLVPSAGAFTTEFYILGKAGLAEDYPRMAAPGEVLSVTMGIHTLERGVQTYRVEVWALDVWEERAEQVAATGSFTLIPGETLEQALAWSMPWSGLDQQVEFRLYTAAQDVEVEAPYRLLRLWLDVEQLWR